jgi:acetyl esterase/lipase
MKGCTIDRIKIPSTDRDIRMIIIKPSERRAELTPGILWLHGGGYISGMPEMVFFTRGFALVRKYGAVVVAPAYRLSFENPYPAALEDCVSALKWLKDNAAALGVDPGRIMVGGESAGGGLTAAVCMHARDFGYAKISFQMPLYPMLDDRPTPSSIDNHAPVWDTNKNLWSWKLYLKGLEDIPPYAAPGRQTDYSKLPPCYTYVGDIEPFYCETLTYVDNLQKAGVPAKVDVYPGWFHAYDIYQSKNPQSRRAIAEFERQYLFAAEHYRTLG